MLHCNGKGEVTHANPVPHVESVPSRREAIAAFECLKSYLAKYYDVMDMPDLDIVQDFLKSR
jgi:hypothetical protein